MTHTERPPTPTDYPGASLAAVATAIGKVERPTPALAEAMDRGYEPKDISLRGLFIFLGTLVVTLVIVFAIIYGIMMALIDHDRSADLKGVAVSIIRPPVYAPLQPSLEHPTEDWEDMHLMRQQTQAILDSAGTSKTGRRYMTIADAMNVVVPKLAISDAKDLPKPYVPAWTYSPESHEGEYHGSTRADVK